MSVLPLIFSCVFYQLAIVLGILGIKFLINLIIVNILANSKLRVLNFGYIIAVNMIAMPINFLRNQQV